MAFPVVYVLDTKTLQNHENSGFSINDALGQAKSLSRTSDLFKSNDSYRSVADTLGKSLPHDKKNIQLPDAIPENSGDVPEMVSRLRGVEDKGARSEKDLKGGSLFAEWRIILNWKDLARPGIQILEAQAKLIFVGNGNGVSAVILAFQFPISLLEFVQLMKSNTLKL
jgi:hypothetical protein